MIRGVLLDLDGVLYNGEQPIPGASAAVAAIRRSGLRALFVTNTTSRPRSALRAKLRHFGVPVQEDELLTPPAAAAAWIRAQGRGKAALLVPDATKSEFPGLEAGDDDPLLRYVVLGDLGSGWTFEKLNGAFRLLHGRPDRQLVSLGLTRYWLAPDGVRLDVAPFAAALECATGRKAVTMGKPAKQFFRQAAARLGLPPAELLMVGDDLRADALGARSAGLQSALVKTGKFLPSDLQQPEQPDWILESVRDLPALLADCRE